MGSSALDFRLRRFGGIKSPLLCRSPAFHAGYFVGKAGDFFLHAAHTTPGSPAKAQPPGDLEHVQRDVRIRSKTSKTNVNPSFSCCSSPLPRTKNQYTSCAGFSFCAREGTSNKAAAFMPQAISPVQQRRPQPAAETGRSCWGRVLIFQSPAKGLRKNQLTQPVAVA